jgi:hypothetical protein
MTLMLGRKPALFPAGLRDLTYYRAGSLPIPPVTVAVPSVTSWQMLGNDKYGDCGVAGLEHGFMADAADTDHIEGFPTDQDAVSYYLSYTDGQDTGVVLSQYLQHVQQNGYYGHTVSAYAPVTVNDITTLQFAINAYDFAYTGITVTSAMQEAFSNQQPWTMKNTGGPVEGGHCIPLVGYDDQYLYAVTWGAIQSIAYPAWNRIADEAWAVITGEVAAATDDGHGISLAALQADLTSLNS